MQENIISCDVCNRKTKKPIGSIVFYFDREGNLFENEPSEPVFLFSLQLKTSTPRNFDGDICKSCFMKLLKKSFVLGVGDL